MGIFDKKGEAPPKGDEKISAAAGAEGSVRPRRDCECYIAEGISMEGKITGTTSIGLDGNFTGTFDISSKLIIGETGEFKGEIQGGMTWSSPEKSTGTSRRETFLRPSQRGRFTVILTPNASSSRTAYILRETSP